MLVDICTTQSILLALFILVASANDIQRLDDDDSEVEIHGPQASRVGKRRAAKKRDEEKK